MNNSFSKAIRDTKDHYHHLSNLNCIKLTIFLITASFFLQTKNLNAQTYPAGFSQILVANGISNPTTMAFAPDGRLFIAQQTGQLRIVKNGALLATPFTTISVNSSGERGLLGIAFDPSFATNNYIYLYYTLSSGTNNRISRFTANGDLVVPGSEIAILNLDPLSAATNHNGGTMQFGPDGKLYIGVGENANSANSQNLNNYLGKVLRINSDGSVPTGNPYTTGTAQKLRIWSHGLRNPYSLTFQPGTGRLFVNDVGQNAWEEINEATTGGLNFGWPAAEGMDPNPAYTNPLYVYSHGTAIGQGCAITGGSFFNPTTTNYPSNYTGNYFFIDYCGNWIDKLSINGTTVSRTNFASNISGSPVAISTGPDGNLYLLSRTNSAVYKIAYTNLQSPVITGQPQTQNVSQGNPVTFSVSVTGATPLSYQWKKNTNNITGATNNTYTINTAVVADTGNYSVVVSNTFGNTTSNNAVLTVTPVNQAPIANILTPTANSTYAGGNTINFSGSATDQEDGNLSANGFNWYVEFHHSTHIHPGPSAPSGVSSGAFTIPNSGETASNVFYRLILVVTDSQGASDTSYVDILPRTSQITIQTNPQGLQITLEGQPFTAPLTVTSVEGILRTLSAPNQTVNGKNYTFNSWSQGGTITKTFATPANDIIDTAVYFTNSSLIPLADAEVRNGSYSNNNFGTTRTLTTRNTTTNNTVFQSYIKFNISTLGNNQSSVKLKLSGYLLNTNNSQVIVQVQYVPVNTWTENTITFSNRPSPNSVIIDTVIIAGTTLQNYELDVTTLINSLRTSGVTTVSFAVTNQTVTNSNRVIFRSKEATTNRPSLVATGSNLRELENATPEILEVRNSESQFMMSVFPNPANDYLTVKYSEVFANSLIRITDLNGKIIRESKIYEPSEETIPLTDLTPGFYVVTLTGKMGQLTRHFLINR